MVVLGGANGLRKNLPKPHQVHQGHTLFPQNLPHSFVD